MIFWSVIVVHCAVALFRCSVPVEVCEKDGKISECYKRIWGLDWVPGLGIFTLAFYPEQYRAVVIDEAIGTTLRRADISAVSDLSEVVEGHR